MPAFASHGLYKGVRGVESRIYLPGINVGFKEELYIYPASYTAFPTQASCAPADSHKLWLR